MEKIAQVGLAGIIIKIPDRVLLGKRKGSHGSGTWAFPGGHIRQGENYEDCFYRELEEETGLGIKEVTLCDESPISITNDIFKNDNKHYITLFFRGIYNPREGIEPYVKEPHKCEKWSWFKWSDLPKPLFLPIKNLLKQGYNPFTGL